MAAGDPRETYRRIWRRTDRGYAGVREFVIDSAAAGLSLEATVQAAEAGLPTGDPWPDADTVQYGTTTVTAGVYDEGNDRTPVTAAAVTAAFSAGMVGKYLIVAGGTAWKVATRTSATAITVTGNAAGVIAVGGEDFCVVGLWRPVVQEVSAEIDSEAGKATLTARYWTPAGGALRRARGYLVPAYSLATKTVDRDKNGATIGRMFRVDGTWYRWALSKGGMQVSYPRKRYLLAVEVGDLAVVETLVDTLIGKTNSAIWQGHAAATLLFEEPRVQQLGGSERRFAVVFRLAKADPGEDWASMVEVVKQEYAVQTLEADTGRVSQVGHWEDSAGPVTEYRDFYATADFSGLSKYVI